MQPIWTKAKLSISAYWPVADEIDVRPLMLRLFKCGHMIFLPVVQGPTAPLLFRKWTPDTELFDGGFGTSIPGPDSVEGIPSVLLVPILAFDGEGFRLGYGGGFYDRTLQSFRDKKAGVISVGVAYEAQFVTKLPIEEHDQRLDFVVTEVQTRRCIPEL